MIAPLSCAEGPGVNVLKPHQKGAVITLLENEVSQHEISRKTGIDRKTVRKLALAMAAARSGEGSNSPMATGSAGVPAQLPPPRPPALGARSPPAGLPPHARSACEGHREWIETQVRLGRNATAISVENAIGHTQATALKGRRFESLDEQNAYLQHWEEKWAALRIHGRAKRQVEAMFQEERAHLKALPLESFRYFEEGTRTVGDDTTIQVDSAWYAARPARIGSQVLIRLYEHELEIRDLHTLELIRRHPRASCKGEVQLPDNERVFNPSRQTHQLLARAEHIGPHTLALCRELFAQRGREAQKSMWGIVGLSPRYPTCILEQAAAVALARQIHSYKAVRALSEQLLAQAVIDLDARQPQLPLTQQHELIRAPAEYAEFFDRLAAANALTLATEDE
jgi:hypothetical protein